MHRWTPHRNVVLIASLIFLTASLFRTDIGVTSTVQATWKNTQNEFQKTARPTQVNRSTVVEIKQPEINATYPLPVPAKPQYPHSHPRATRLTKTATIVVQLSGEMANNLQHIAHGIGLKLWAKEDFDIDCNLVLRHHEGPNNRSPKPKWKSARDNIQQCFPKLASWSFSRGNSKDFKQRQRLQRIWLEGRSDHLFGLINSANASEIQRGLAFLANDVLTDPERPWVEAESPLRLPFLFSESLDVFPMIDKYYSQIRDLMAFNDTACCAQVPHANASVFHFRNYQSEMPSERAYDMGFAELSPQKTAHELFGHLQPGDRVQITTRIYNQAARNYAEAFLKEERGIHASLVTDQTGVEDFCFLRRAQKELVGNARSTYVLWAALLGTVTRARLYHVDNWGLRNRHPNFLERFTYNWTDPELQNRIQFVLYQAEEMEKN
jgi:hypothetical protein